ncbi:tetratricopeptide repeat protein [Nannocystaceae bacterium ST9]
MRTASLSILVALGSLACPAADSPRPEGAKAADATKPTDATKASPEPADAKTPEPADAKPDAVADKRAKAKAKITGTDDAELAKRRTQMLASLNEGRKLVKDGDFAGGIAKYEALLAIAPHYGPALGELGWAEFKAGKFDDANAHTQRALAETSDAHKRGMLLYNLGRVAEARGQNDAAIGHYQASLAARPNDTVAARLTELQAKATAPVVAPPPDAPVPPGLRVLAKDLADLDALCKAAGSESMCGSENCEIIATPARETGLGMLQTGDWGVKCWQPVVNTPSGWTLFELAVLGQSGSEVDQDVDSIEGRLENNDVGEFLVVEFSDHVYERVWSESDFEGDEGEGEPEPPDWDSTDRKAVILCRREGVPTCTSPITTQYDSSGEGEGGSASYSANWSLRGDVVVITNVTSEGKLELGLAGGGWDGYLMLAAGEYPFADLAKATR